MSSHETSSTNPAKEGGHSATMPASTGHTFCDDQSCQQYWSEILAKHEADYSVLHAEYQASISEGSQLEQNIVQLEAADHQQTDQIKSLQDDVEFLIASVTARETQLSEYMNAHKNLKLELNRVLALNAEYKKRAVVQSLPTIQEQQSQDKQDIEKSQSASAQKALGIESVLHTVLEHVDEVLAKIGGKISIASRDLDSQSRLMDRYRAKADIVFTEGQQEAAQDIGICPHEHNAVTSTLTGLKKFVDVNLAAQDGNIKGVKKAISDLGEETRGCRKKLFDDAASMQRSAGCLVIMNPLDTKSTTQASSAQPKPQEHTASPGQPQKPPKVPSYSQSTHKVPAPSSTIKKEIVQPTPASGPAPVSASAKQLAFSGLFKKTADIPQPTSGKSTQGSPVAPMTLTKTVLPVAVEVSLPKVVLPSVEVPPKPQVPSTSAVPQKYIPPKPSVVSAVPKFTDIRPAPKAPEASVTLRPRPSAQAGTGENAGAQNAPTLSKSQKKKAKQQAKAADKLKAEREKAEEEAERQGKKADKGTTALKPAPAPLTKPVLESLVLAPASVRASTTPIGQFGSSNKGSEAQQPPSTHGTAATIGSSDLASKVEGSVPVNQPSTEQEGSVATVTEPQHSSQIVGESTRDPAPETSADPVDNSTETGTEVSAQQDQPDKGEKAQAVVSSTQAVVSESNESADTVSSSVPVPTSTSDLPAEAAKGAGVTASADSTQDEKDLEREKADSRRTLMAYEDPANLSEDESEAEMSEGERKEWSGATFSKLTHKRKGMWSRD